MLLKNFVISNVIFACQAIFSALYTGKSSGKQDYYNLRGYCMACQLSRKNLLEFKKMYSGQSSGNCWKLVRLDL